MHTHAHTIHLSSTDVSVWWCIAIILMLIVFAFLAQPSYFRLFISYFCHQQNWVLYSPSFPDRVSHFSGREKEISDIVHWLDPHNTDVRVVSIVGPPGFGKSSLAIHVGHEMIDQGVVVNYVNLDELTVEDLPEKIVANDGITTRNGSFERLQKWLRTEINFPVLLMLHSCDDVLYREKNKIQNFFSKPQGIRYIQ